VKSPKWEETRKGIYVNENVFSFFVLYSDAGFIRSPLLPFTAEDVVE